ICVELARMAEDCGLDAVAMHARTREQGYSGNARWEWIAAVKAAVRVPVIDRKSTRLNSSHLVISYAVFCLKKKDHADRVTDASITRIERDHQPPARLRLSDPRSLTEVMQPDQLISAYCSCGLATVGACPLF